MTGLLVFVVTMFSLMRWSGPWTLLADGWDEIRYQRERPAIEAWLAAMHASAVA